MVNTAHIDEMIVAISAEEKPIYMGTFVNKNMGCGTTACLAGWANILRCNKLHEPVYDWEAFVSEPAAARWMGLDRNQAHNLFYHFRVDQLPHEQRRAATLDLLIALKEKGDASWEDVLQPYLAFADPANEFVAGEDG